MNQYIKFIVRVLLTCFFIAFFGSIIQVLCGLEQYLWGWLWGIFIMVLYLLSLACMDNLLCQEILIKPYVNLVDR